MFVDDRLEFCDAVSLDTGAAGNYLLGDSVDLGTARDLGNGEPFYLVVSVDTTATSGGSATGTFQFVTADNAALSSNLVVLAATAAIPVASLVAGTQYVIPLPAEGTAYKRYIGFRQVTGTAAFTAGKVNAFLTRHPSLFKSYPDAVN